MSDKEVQRWLRSWYTNIRWFISLVTTMYHMHLVFDLGAPGWTLALHIGILLRWHIRANREALCTD